jgi:hypothetical protein
MTTMPPTPPTMAQHAKAWIMHEWTDSRHRHDARAECDDVMHPFATHPACERISGTFHEGAWFVYVSAQSINPTQPVRVTVGTPAYDSFGANEDTKHAFTKVLMKAPIQILFGKI